MVTPQFDIPEDVGRMRRLSWHLTAKDPEGAAYLVGFWEFLCAQVVGNWDGAEVALEGSNDGTAYRALYHPSEIPTNLPASALYVRPKLFDAGEHTTLTVTLVGVVR